MQKQLRRWVVVCSLVAAGAQLGCKDDPEDRPPDLDALEAPISMGAPADLSQLEAPPRGALLPGPTPMPLEATPTPFLEATPTPLPGYGEALPADPAAAATGPPGPSGITITPARPRATPPPRSTPPPEPTPPPASTPVPEPAPTPTPEPPAPSAT